MSSRSSRAQNQQQQRAMFADPCDSRSTATTSRMRSGNGMTGQHNSSDVQGGCRSEPLRPKPSYPAPSTIYPDDSASLHGSQIGSDSGSRRNVNQFDTNPNYAPRNLQMPQATPQTSSPYSSSRGSQYQYASPSLYEYIPGNDPDGQLLEHLFGPDAPSRVRNTPTSSTARSANRPPSDMPQSSTRGSAAGSGAGMSTGAISQNRALVPSAGLPFNSNGAQLSPGISIGVLPGTQMHFHYNQVDNRQLNINNNAPHNAVTHNNQNYTTDNSSHHNTHAPHANTYSTHAANLGNSHTNVSQRAKTARQGTPSSSTRAPSETIRIRDRLTTRVSRKDVPNDRPC